MTTTVHSRSDDGNEETMRRLRKLGLYGLANRLADYAGQPWIGTLLDLEESERQRRGLERRMRLCKLDRFKSITDFDWSWPKQIDRTAIQDLFDLSFVKEASNVVLLGPNGVGKTMIAKNLAHLAVMKGFTARYTTASNLLTDLASQDGARALTARLRTYTKPQLLVIDEIGYLSANARDADLLFEVVSRRYEKGSIVVTTNRPLKEWNDVFPSSACVVTLIDRLCHHSEVLTIDAESYRLKEAKERAQSRRRRKSS